MKPVYVALVNEEFKDDPEDDTPMFNLYLDECPAVGDFVFLCDPENYDEDEWFTDLYALCKEKLPQSRSCGYRFKVTARTMMRDELESWWIIDLIYIPGIQDNINH